MQAKGIWKQDAEANVHIILFFELHTLIKGGIQAKGIWNKILGRIYLLFYFF